MSEQAGGLAMDVALEIFASVMGYHATEEGYEMLMGMPVGQDLGDAEIMKLSMAFQPRDQPPHKYIDWQDGKGWKNANKMAQWWRQNYGYRIVESDYHAFWPKKDDFASGGYLNNNMDVVLSEIVDFGKVVPESWEMQKWNRLNGKNIDMNPLSMFVGALIDDYENGIEYYDTLITPLSDSMGGPIKWGQTYETLEESYNKNRGDVDNEYDANRQSRNLYHAIMQLPLTDKQGRYRHGWIAVIPYRPTESKYGLSKNMEMSQMAFLDITEPVYDPLDTLPLPNGQLKSYFGEDAFAKWKEVRLFPHQSINVQIIKLD